MGEPRDTPERKKISWLINKPWWRLDEGPPASRQNDWYVNIGKAISMMLRKLKNKEAEK